MRRCWAAAGSHLGSLAGRDLAARCAEGRLDARGKAKSRAVRKRALTAESSSRWAGAITRASEDQVRLAEQNQTRRAGQPGRPGAADRGPARDPSQTAARGGRGGTRPRPNGTRRTSACEALKARLARVQRQAQTGRVWVTRGGRGLLRTRNNLGGGRTEPGAVAGAVAGGPAVPDRRRGEGQGVGQRDDPVAPRRAAGWRSSSPRRWRTWANRPRGRYRLSCPVAFAYRGDEVAAQAATGAVRYDISYDAAKDRWYLDASWKTAPAPALSLQGLRRHPVVAVDVNAGHLAVAVVSADGNLLGAPFTVPLDLAGLPAATRDGRVRAAVSTPDRAPPASTGAVR